MANATPISTPKPVSKTEPQVTAVTSKPEELLARAQEIVAAQKPAVILDEQVNQIGQERAYGNIKSVQEIVYDEVDRKGNPTGRTRTAIRIDH